MRVSNRMAGIITAATLAMSAVWGMQAQFAAADPGVRGGAANAGQPLPGISAAQLAYFQDGQSRFLQVDSVQGTLAGEPGSGLGPAFNGNSCAGCHAQPAFGGSSPAVNPQIALASLDGATNTVPYFLSLSGPVREARFPYVLENGRPTATADGGVHDVYSIAGRSDAGGCSLAQPDFEQARQWNDIIFRIPTPVFGGGLIEAIPDATLLANLNANQPLKQSLGIGGRPNTSGNDGSITRFGWKAQNKSLSIFAGEAYNVEMGVTNEAFPNERDGAPAGCLKNTTPEDQTNFTLAGTQIPSDVVAFADFMRFLAPPAVSAENIPGNPAAGAIATGKALFSQVHCDLCHTAALSTGGSSYGAALSNQTVPLFSDLMLHHMGSGLADNVSQGVAGPDEFRTAPLWGLGQRLFFLHDGRATPANGGLLTAIEAHASPGSEANRVIALFNALTPSLKQDLLDYLRTL